VLPGRVIVIGQVDDGSCADRFEGVLSALNVRDLWWGRTGFGIHGYSVGERVVAGGGKVIGSWATQVLAGEEKKKKKPKPEEGALQQIK
jgi:hypothetical protein